MPLCPSPLPTHYALRRTQGMRLDDSPPIATPADQHGALECPTPTTLHPLHAPR